MKNRTIKHTGLAAVILISSLSLVSCDNPFTNQNISISVKINEQSEFPLGFLEKIDANSDDFRSSYDCEPGFGIANYWPKSYSSAKGETLSLDYLKTSPFFLVALTAYPDESDGGSYVTKLWCSDPAIKTLGHTLNDSFTDVAKDFQKLGFKLNDSSTSKSGSLSYKDVAFSFTTLGSFSLSVPVTNKNSIIY